MPSDPKHKRSSSSSSIPRPSNSFIFFRTEFIQSYTGPQRELSKHAGRAWHALSSAGQQPYLDMAESERKRHALKYPDYQYKPAPRKEGESERATTMQRHTKEKKERRKGKVQMVDRGTQTEPQSTSPWGTAPDMPSYDQYDFRYGEPSFVNYERSLYDPGVYGFVPPSSASYSIASFDQDTYNTAPPPAASYSANSYDYGSGGHTSYEREQRLSQYDGFLQTHTPASSNHFGPNSNAFARPHHGQPRRH